MARWGARLGLAAALGVLGAIVTVIAIWFLGHSLFLLLVSMPLAPAAAALIVGVVGLVVAALAVLVARRLARPVFAAGGGSQSAAPPTRDSAVNDLAGQIGSLAARQIVASMRAHPYGAIGAGLVAGLAVGALPELRKLLRGVFDR